jgi:hypothetical protein
VFALTSANLDEICMLNEFPIVRSAMVFFGIRGSLPIDPNNHSFQTQHALRVADIDHVHLRCTLIQWNPDGGDFAVYPGSTVPNQIDMRAALATQGEGANQLLTGFYSDFRKGHHKGGTPTGHEAFKQTSNRPYRRTADDLDYDGADRVETGSPGDNLHAGWCQGIEADRFASAGCQVVAGFPDCPKRPGGNTGPWKSFHAAAYTGKRRAQTAFGYVLITGSEVQTLAIAGAANLSRTRFGSKGSRAERVQGALKKKKLYEGIVDGDFGLRSLRALLVFQESAFGPHAEDGVCGPQTAAALGIRWP